MDKMNDNIVSKYPQVKNVTVYGRDAFIREFDKPGATFPKSTVIGKYEPHVNDLEPGVERDTFFDVRDAILKRDRIRRGGAFGDSDLEAGEIRIVIEVDTDAKTENYGWGVTFLESKTDDKQMSRKDIRLLLHLLEQGENRSGCEYRGFQRVV